jgi:hypothetical protein
LVALVHTYHTVSVDVEVGGTLVFVEDQPNLQPTAHRRVHQGRVRQD